MYIISRGLYNTLLIGTPAAAVAVNAATGLFAQARSGTVKWPCAIVFAIAGLAGSLAGAEIGNRQQRDDAPLVRHRDDRDRRIDAGAACQ